MKRHNTAMLGIGLLVGTQACSGGESTCLKIFCNDVVRVNFVPPLTEPGSYVFDLTADDRTTVTVQPTAASKAVGRQAMLA